MEVQTLVVSESELSRLTSEAGLGTITFTTSDGLTIPIHHLDLTSADADDGIVSPEIALPSDGDPRTIIDVDDGDQAIEARQQVSNCDQGTVGTIMMAEMFMAAAEIKSGSPADAVIRLFTSASYQQDDDHGTSLNRDEGRLEDIDECAAVELATEGIDLHQCQQEIKDHQDLNSADVDDVKSNVQKDYPFDDVDPNGSGFRTIVMPDCSQFIVEDGGVEHGADFDPMHIARRSSSTQEIVDESDINDDDDKEGVSSNMVVIDVSKPIQLAQNSLIVVNGQKCVLQQNRETGQLIAYPVKEPEKSQKKRGRPKKPHKDVITSKRHARPVAAESQQIVENGPEIQKVEVEESNVKGLVEMANEDGEIVKRSARKRKKVVLTEYETGKIKNIESDDDDEPIYGTIGQMDDDDDVDALPRKRRTIPAKRPCSGAKSGRKRGRPRRNPAEQAPTSSPSDPPPDTQSFLVQMGDGQTMMIHVPLTSIPDGVSLQNIAQSIAESLNPSKPSSNLKSVLPESASTKTSEITRAVMRSMQDTGDNFLSDMSVTNSTHDLVSSSSAAEQIDVIHTTTTDEHNEMHPSNVETKEEPSIVQNNDKAVSSDLESKQDSPIGDFVEDVTKIADRLTSRTAPTVIPLPPNVFDMLVSGARDLKPIRIGLKDSGEDLEKLRCSKCGFQAFYARQFQDHLATHMTAVHKCKCCGYLTLIAAHLIEHVKNQHPRCICIVCNYHVPKANLMRKHMAKHKEPVTSTCDTCGKTYKDPYILRIHIKNVHLPAEVIFECALCSKKFTRKAHLKRHLRTHDPEMKQFKCDVCDYRSCERSDITKHQLIHQEPKFVCEVCGKAFRHFKNKELHLKRHTGQRDYKCGVCDFYGYTFTDIRRHIERKHADPKTILCEKCGQAFKTDQLRKDHEASDQCELFRFEDALQEEPDSSDTVEPTLLHDVDQNPVADLKQPPGTNSEEKNTERLITDESTTTAIIDLSSVTLMKAPDETCELVTAVASCDNHFATILEDCNDVQKEQHHFTMITEDGKVISNIVMDTSELTGFTVDDENLTH